MMSGARALAKMDSFPPRPKPSATTLAIRAEDAIRQCELAGVIVARLR